MEYEHNDKDLRVLLEDCLDKPDLLNEWEYDFITNLYAKKDMTIKQYRHLLKIWEKLQRTDQ